MAVKMRLGRVRVQASQTSSCFVSIRAKHKGGEAEAPPPLKSVHVGVHVRVL